MVREIATGFGTDNQKGKMLGYVALENELVAIPHVLRDTLQADDAVGCQRQAPELAMVLAQVISGNNGAHALDRGHSIGSSHRRVGTVQVSRLNFFVADVGLAGEPVFTREQGGVGISKCAASRYQGEAGEFEIDSFSLGKLGGWSAL
jgi:hypothetical protein